MNPGRVFSEALESQLFRRSDSLSWISLNSWQGCFAVLLTSDNATLLDILENSKMGRFMQYFVDISAVAG